MRSRSRRARSSQGAKWRDTRTLVRTAGGACAKAASNSSILSGTAVIVPSAFSHERSQPRVAASCVSSTPTGQAIAGAASPRRSRNISILGLPAAAAARNARAFPRLSAARTPSICLHVPSALTRWSMQPQEFVLPSRLLISTS